MDSVRSACSRFETASCDVQLDSSTHDHEVLVGKIILDVVADVIASGSDSN